MSGYSKQQSSDSASDASWQNVASVDVDMESVADSTVTVDIREETLMQTIQEHEEVCNALGSKLHAFEADDLSAIYSFMSLHLGSDYSQLDSRIQERFD